MSLETFEKPGDLYLARVDDVNPLRPLFTGDVVADEAIPGVQDGGMAVVVAHPCSMRGKDAQLEPRALVACLSPFGVNLLQQRFIFRLTRHEVPTYLLQEVSAHVFEEADLLEEWSDTVCAAEMSQGQAAASFEAFMRGDRGGGNTLQSDLRDPQRRSTVRGACRAEAERAAEKFRSEG